MKNSRDTPFKWPGRTAITLKEPLVGTVAFPTAALSAQKAWVSDGLSDAPQVDCFRHACFLQGLLFRANVSPTLIFPFPFLS